MHLFVLGGCCSVEASVCALGGVVHCYCGVGHRSWFGWWFLIAVTWWIVDFCLVGVVLVSCAGICSVYARRNEAGTMLSFVLSLMCFVLKWCPECCCFGGCVKCSLKRSSISSIVLDRVLFNVER